MIYFLHDYSFDLFAFLLTICCDCFEEERGVGVLVEETGEVGGGGVGDGVVEGELLRFITKVIVLVTHLLLIIN